MGIDSYVPAYMHDCMVLYIANSIQVVLCKPHGRTGRKKLGGQKEICPTFRIVPDHFRKIIFRNKLISSTSPPPPRSVYHFRGQKNFSGTIHFQYWPTFKRILHDYLYLNNKLRAFWLFGFLFPTFCPTYVEYLPDFSTL
jgi:hypothetical protein